jgi:antitoxin CptB
MIDRDRNAELRWRLRRGMRELDLILGRFHETQYARLPDPDRRLFVELLNCEDDDLWVWLTGRGEPARDDLADVVRRIRRHAGL